MNKSRVLTFTDGMIAIIMTILVLELKAPVSHEFIGLWLLREKILVYVLSFFLLAVTWNNHHHIFQIAKKIDGRVLWVNIFMLFWMSLIPFATSWVGDDIYSFAPEITYGVVFLLFNTFNSLLAEALIRANGKDSDIYRILKKDKKLHFPLIINIAALVFGFIYPPLCADYMLFCASSLVYTKSSD